MMNNQILLVDDDLDLLESFQESLNIRGYKTITATNGKEAIEIYEQEIPCIIFMDIKMPIIDGYEAFLKIKEKYSNAKIVFITGNKTSKKIEDLYRHGLLKILDKPVGIKDIISTIKENDC